MASRTAPMAPSMSAITAARSIRRRPASCRPEAECNGHKLSAPNDIVFDKQGGFYFTDLGKRYAHHRDNGGLYYALPDGSRVIELAHPMLTPNGVRPSPDARTVHVADTGSSRLVSFHIVQP